MSLSSYFRDLMRKIRFKNVVIGRDDSDSLEGGYLNVSDNKRLKFEEFVEWCQEKKIECYFVNYIKRLRVLDLNFMPRLLVWMLPKKMSLSQMELWNCSQGLVSKEELFLLFDSIINIDEMNDFGQFFQHVPDNLLSSLKSMGFFWEISRCYHYSFIFKMSPIG
jgi:hypothetical protein